MTKHCLLAMFAMQNLSCEKCSTVVLNLFGQHTPKILKWSLRTPKMNYFWVETGYVTFHFLTSADPLDPHREPLRGPWTPPVKNLWCSRYTIQNINTQKVCSTHFLQQNIWSHSGLNKQTHIQYKQQQDTERNAISIAT